MVLHSLLVRWRRFERRHALPSFIIVNWALGAAVGLVCVALLLIFDPVGLRPLLARSDMAFVAVAMLCGGFAVTFGGVVCAGAVMMLSDRGPDGGRRALKGKRLGQRAPEREFRLSGATISRG